MEEEERKKKKKIQREVIIMTNEQFLRIWLSLKLTVDCKKPCSGSRSPSRLFSFFHVITLISCYLEKMEEDPIVT